MFHNGSRVAGARAECGWGRSGVFGAQPPARVRAGGSKTQASSPRRFLMDAGKYHAPCTTSVRRGVICNEFATFRFFLDRQNSDR